MNKQELASIVAKEAGLTQAQATQFIDGFTASIRGALKKGNDVTLVGFGSFKIAKRAARMGVNPKTGNAFINTWILCTEMDPLDAIVSGADHAICGNCLKRGIATGKNDAANRYRHRPSIGIVWIIRIKRHGHQRNLEHPPCHSAWPLRALDGA